MRILALSGMLFVLVSMSGCIDDARHSNPLDPLSDEYLEEGSVGGVVLDRLFRPLERVQVRLRALGDGEPSPWITETDGDGRFQFGGVAAGTYELTTERVGYQTEIDTVQVEIGRLRLVADIRMNALPVVTTSHSRAIHISRWWPEDDLFILDVSVRVVDPDERPGIGSVWLDLAPASRFNFQPGVEPGEYALAIPADSLDGTTVHSLVGTPLIVGVADRDGNEIQFAIPGPVRVIDPTPVAASPQNLETIDDPSPMLTWNRTQLPYPFTYQVEVVRDEVNADFLVHRRGDIHADSLSYRVSQTLSPGAYYWTVAVVDQYGNLSRSREAGFRVDP